MTDAAAPAPRFLVAADGARLAWREIGPEGGGGRPLLLIHGYISDAVTNWISYGTATRLAAAGFRCLMPDLRAHGESGKPHDPAFYPPDVLADDQFALLAHLGLQDYDLAGYSLGARTATRMLARGAAPRRAILAGMGFEGVTDTGTRSAHFRHVLRNLGSHPKGSPAWMAEAFLKTTGGDPVALDLILETFVDTPPDALAAITVPVAVICGVEDRDNGSAARLADALGHARLIEIPGNHMSAVTKPDFGEAIAAFLQ